jgi:hypothetical protein
MVDPESYQSRGMLEQVARAIAEADAADFDAEPRRYLGFAEAAIIPLTRPTPEMIDAACDALGADIDWPRDSLQKAVQAMMMSIMRRSQ